MSNFALLATDPQGDLISSVNYLLATQGQANANAILGNSLIANTSSGQITTVADPNYLSYLYQYINVRYADSADGTVNFNISPTNRYYFGVRNTPTTTASSNPADYIWTAVVGGFGTTNFLYYQTNGGRQIQWQVTNTLPTNFAQTEDGVAINLDVLTGPLGTNGTSAVSLTITYDQGQFFTHNTDGTWSPNANANGYSTTTTTITATQGDTVVGQLTRTLSLDTNNSFVSNGTVSTTGNISVVDGYSGIAATSADGSSYFYSFRDPYSGGIYGGTEQYFNVTGGPVIADIFLVGAGRSGNVTSPGDAGEYKFYPNVVIPPGNYIVNVGDNAFSNNASISGNSYVTINGTTFIANGGAGRTGLGAGSTANATTGGAGLADPWNGLMTNVSSYYTWYPTVNASYEGNVFQGNLYWFAGGGAPLATTGTHKGGIGGGGSSINNVGWNGRSFFGAGGGAGATAGGFQIGGIGTVVIRQSSTQQNLIGNLWVFGGNVPGDINAESFGFANAVYSSSNYARQVTYFSNGAGNISGTITAAVIQRGNTGPSGPSGPQGPSGNVGAQGSRGFIPMAYVVTATDPTGYTNAQLTTAFSASRTSTVPPIGTGYTPITGDTAQFVYRTTGAYVVKTFNANTTAWTTANAQVIDGNVIVTGSITSSQLNANDVYALTVASTNANVGNVSSNGFWLQANTGDARFGGNVSIGANLNVAGLITTSALQTNTVNTTTIISNAVSTFGSYSNNSDSIIYSPASSTYYALTGNVTLTTVVPNTKAVVSGQSLTSFYANVTNAPQALTTNIGVLVTDSTGTYVLTQESLTLSYFANGNVQQNDFSYYETGTTLNLANVDTYTFRLFSYYVPSSANITVFAQDSINRRLLVQTYKR